MTTMTTTIIMITMGRHRRWWGQLWRRWRRRFRCRSGSGRQVTPVERTKQDSKLYSAGSGQRIWNSAKHSPTAGKIRGANSGRQNPGYGFWARKTTHARWTKSGGAKSGLRIVDSKNSPTGGKIREAKFRIRKTLRPRSGKSGGQNPGGKIQATDFGLGKACTYGGDKIRGAKSADFGLGKPLTHGGTKSRLRSLDS